MLFSLALLPHYVKGEESLIVREGEKQKDQSFNDSKTISKLTELKW